MLPVGANSFAGRWSALKPADEHALLGQVKVTQFHKLICDRNREML